MNLFSKIIILLSLALALALSGCGSSVAGGTVQPPSVIFSTYLGGHTSCLLGEEPLTFAQDCACDSQGDVYVTGTTQVSDLPVKNAFQPAPAPNSAKSAFVAKYGPTGELLWCTYLGGRQESGGVAIAALPDGGAAVTGITTSDNFPTFHPCQEHLNGLSDYFVAAFDAQGRLTYSTYLGGSGTEGEADALFADDSNNGNHLAADDNGLVYLTGETDSAGGEEEIKYPVTENALQKDLAGDTDAVVSVINPQVQGRDSLLYSSFLGGADNEKGHAVAVEGAGGHFAVAGYTKSRNFPTTPNGYRSAPAPQGFISNAFVVRFGVESPGVLDSAYQMSYSTYLGANSSEARDETYSITLDNRGRIIATGRTQSPDYPMRGAYLPSIYNRAPYLEPETSGDQPYLVKIDPELSGTQSLVYSSFLGGGQASGEGGGFGTGVAVDGRGAAYVAGEINSPGIPYKYSPTPQEAPQLFPYTWNAFFPALQGQYDVFLMKIGPTGSVLEYSTFWGGQESDRSYGLAIDPWGNTAVSGLTFSRDFPLQNPAQTWPGNAGHQNAFISKFKL